ncbi:hypothetical protein MO973_30910 [Paenibacillus sp. TRM 82003]|nr:hypothetical protein [Paenibacillus sp. TRM 82003]
MWIVAIVAAAFLITLLRIEAFTRKMHENDERIVERLDAILEELRKR